MCNLMELISVIIPIYKAERYLDRCVNSIVKQTYSNLEIILVDDGSPDKCPELCDAWLMKDKRVKVIHQDNQGVSVARNTGISSAKGNYILMVDSDDYIAIDMIEKLFFAMKNSNADVALCDYIKGSEETIDFKGLQNSGMIEEISAKVALERIYLGDHQAIQYVAPWGKLYKRELFKGINYPIGKIFEDIYVTHQLLFRCNTIAVLFDRLTYYFQHPDSIMNKGFHIGKLDYLEALKKRISFYEEHGLTELQWVAYDEYLHALIWEYSRARDILSNRNAMKDIVASFRKVYIKGYASKRYPKESAIFLRAFHLNPELIIIYWKICAKLNLN